MITIIGILIIVVGLICWLGQSLSIIAPNMALKLGLLDPKEDMDETLYIIESKALGLNDLLLTWTLPAAGFLMIVNNPLWPYLGMVGGGIYLYFSGFIIFTRIYLKREGKKVGSTSAEKTAYIFSLLWILASLTMLVLSYNYLSR